MGKKRTHCKRGHLLHGKNLSTHVRRRPGKPDRLERQCSRCESERQKLSYARHRSKAARALVSQGDQL